MLHHQISTVQVFCSDNYDDFSFIIGNRPLNMHKIGKIIEDIESGNDMLIYYPIIVRVEGNKMLILKDSTGFIYVNY